MNTAFGNFRKASALFARESDNMRSSGVMDVNNGGLCIQDCLLLKVGFGSDRRQCHPTKPQQWIDERDLISAREDLKPKYSGKTRRLHGNRTERSTSFFSEKNYISVRFL